MRVVGSLPIPDKLEITPEDCALDLFGMAAALPCRALMCEHMPSLRNSLTSAQQPFVTALL